MKIKKYKYKLLAILCVALALGYFYLFFQKGIDFENTFLRLSQSNNMYQYKGSAYGEDILITVEGDLSESDTAKGTYTIENFDTRVFTVNISNRVGNSVDVKIFDRFGLIYEGSYIPTILINNNGNLYMEEPRITFTNSGGDTFYEDYKISYSHIVSTALRDNVYMRGNWVFLLYATLVISILIIDINWPLFLFNMRYGHAVKKAEPSDRYLAAQKISRIIYPIVAIIFLIASLS